MSWIQENWLPLTVVGGLISISWYAGKKFEEQDSFNADEEDMVYCNHCSDIIGNEKEVYDDETVDYEMANGEVVCVPCHKIWMKEYENDLDPHYTPFYAETFNADEGLWNDASKEQRLKWLKDAIPSVGDKYADYTWRELTPRLQEEMGDESYDAESYNADSDNAFAICERKKQHGIRKVFDNVKKMRKCKTTDNTNYYEIESTMIYNNAPRTKTQKALLCDTCVETYKPFIGTSIPNKYDPTMAFVINDIKLIGGNEDYLKDEIQKNKGELDDYVVLAMGRQGKKLHLGRVHTIDHLGNPVYWSCGVENKYGMAWQQMVREVPKAEMENITCKKCLKTINIINDRIEQLENELETYDAESYDTETFAAYVSKADTQRVRQLLKQEFPNLKFSVVKDGGRMSVSIMAGDIDFSDINDDVPRLKRYWERWGNPKPVFDGRLDINQYHLDGYNPKYTPLFEKIVSIMKGERWYDDSDPQTDYFNTAYYIDLNIGKWNKPYEYKPTIKKGTRPTLEGLVYKQGYGDDALTGLKGAYDAETFEAPRKKTDFSDLPIQYKTNRMNSAICISKPDDSGDSLCGKAQFAMYCGTSVGSESSRTEISCAKCKSLFTKMTDEEKEKVRAYGFEAETFEAVAVSKKEVKTPVEKVIQHERMMNELARNDLLTKLTYDLSLRRGGVRKATRRFKNAE